MDIRSCPEDLECLEIFSGFGRAVAKAFRDKNMSSCPGSCILDRGLQPHHILDCTLIISELSI